MAAWLVHASPPRPHLSKFAWHMYTRRSTCHMRITAQANIGEQMPLAGRVLLVDLYRTRYLLGAFHKPEPS